METMSMASQLQSMGQTTQWSMMFPDLMSYTSQYASLLSSATTSPFYAQLKNYVGVVRGNYSYIGSTIQMMTNTYVDSLNRNITHYTNSLILTLRDLDSLLRVASNGLRQRPECGTTDAMMFRTNITSTFSPGLQYFSSATSALTYLSMYSGTSMLSTLYNALQMACSDTQDPIDALQRVESNLVVHTIDLVARQMRNSLVAADYIINANYIIAITELHKSMISILGNITTYTCQYPDMSPAPAW